MRKYAKVELIVHYWEKENPTIRVIRRFFKTAIDKIINDYSGSNMDKDIVVEVARVELNEYNYVYHYVPIARLKGGVENDS